MLVMISKGWLAEMLVIKRNATMPIELILTMPFSLQMHTCEVYEGESVGA